MRFLAAAVMMVLGFSSVALAQDQAAAPVGVPESTPQRQWQFGVQLGYSPNYLAKLSGDGTVSGTPTNIDYDLEYKGAVEVGFNAWFAPQHSWGFISGIQLGAERDLDKLTMNGVTYTANGQTSKFQTHFLYAGTLYRWESFYIPLAFTIGINKFTPAGTGDGEASNGFGVMLGLGWFFNNNWAVEFSSRSTTTKLKLSSGSDSIEVDGAIGSALLSGKYFF